MNIVKLGLGRPIILAPILFAGHFLEESAGFVTWFNNHSRNGITTGLFWNVNILALVITLMVMMIELLAPTVFSASLVVLWFSFLMLANAIFHITGAIVDQHYMPGVVSALVLYLPYYFLMVVRLMKQHRLKIGILIILAVLGSTPMLIHGYLIIFRGSRLF